MSAAAPVAVCRAPLTGQKPTQQIVIVYIELQGRPQYGARVKGTHHTRQEVIVDLKSNILWAIASVALIVSALYADNGPATPLMADYSETSEETAG